MNIKDPKKCGRVNRVKSVFQNQANTKKATNAIFIVTADSECGFVFMPVDKQARPRSNNRKVIAAVRVILRLGLCKRRSCRCRRDKKYGEKSE